MSQLILLSYFHNEVIKLLYDKFRPYKHKKIEEPCIEIEFIAFTGFNETIRTMNFRLPHKQVVMTKIDKIAR